MRTRSDRATFNEEKKGAWRIRTHAKRRRSTWLDHGYLVYTNGLDGDLISMSLGNGCAALSQQISFWPLENKRPQCHVGIGCDMTNSLVSTN